MSAHCKPPACSPSTTALHPAAEFPTRLTPSIFLLRERRERPKHDRVIHSVAVILAGFVVWYTQTRPVFSRLSVVIHPRLICAPIRSQGLPCGLNHSWNRSRALPICPANELVPTAGSATRGVCHPRAGRRSFCDCCFSSSLVTLALGSYGVSVNWNFARTISLRL